MEEEAMRRLAMVVTVITVAAFVTAGTVVAGLAAGSLPSAAFAFTGVTVNDVNMGGDVKLKTKGPTTVKTTYSRVGPSSALLGWHYHNGPVIVSVAVGTLTFYDATCGTWDLSAGESYIESRGEVLNAAALPDRNVGIANVEWFTTRLYPEGAADPVPVDPPCVP
jgi:hypothetical protein